MTKNMKFASACALCIAMVPAISGCDKDNKYNEPDSVHVVQIDGTRVTAVGPNRIEYDYKNRPYRFYSSYENTYIDYEEGTFEYDGEDEELGLGEMDIRFNSKGYITELSGSWDYTDKEEGVSYKGSGKLKFSYNGDGNIVKIESTASESFKGMGISASTSENMTGNLTWKDGNLVTSTQKGSVKGFEENYSWTEKLTYTYGSTENAYRQVPLALSYIFGDINSPYCAMAAVGLFGVGSKYLPVEMNEEYVETGDEEENDIETTTIDYSLNANGSIAREKLDYSWYNWSYGTSRTAADPFSPAKKHTVRDLFIHTRR